MLSVRWQPWPPARAARREQKADLGQPEKQLREARGGLLPCEDELLGIPSITARRWRAETQVTGAPAWGEQEEGGRAPASPSRSDVPAPLHRLPRPPCCPGGSRGFFTRGVAQALGGRGDQETSEGPTTRCAGSRRQEGFAGWTRPLVSCAWGHLHSQHPRVLPSHRTAASPGSSEWW